MSKSAQIQISKTLMSKTICKFQITSKEKSETHVYNKNHPVPVVAVTMMPVYTGSKENEEFFASTPGGNIMLSVVNRDALEGFEVGDEVFVTIEKSPKN